MLNTEISKTTKETVASFKTEDLMALLADIDKEASKRVVVEPVTITEAKPKKAKKPRKERAKLPEAKDERIAVTLGEKVDGVVLLERKDLMGSEADKRACKAHLMSRLHEAPKKVANRITYIMEYVAGKTAILNNVAKMAMECLVKDGYVSCSTAVSNRGNLYNKLIDYPYAPTSASAMGNNTVKAMQVLKIVVPNDSGKLVANPDSVYFQTLKNKLKL